MRIKPRRIRALVVALLLGGAAAAGAQARPDFSGEWVLNRPGPNDIVTQALTRRADRAPRAVVQLSP